VTLDDLRAGWVQLLRNEELFYLLVFIIVIIIIYNVRTVLWKLIKLPFRLVFGLAGAGIGIAVLWGVYHLFCG